MSDESIAVALEMMKGYSRITWLEVIKLKRSQWWLEQKLGSGAISGIHF
jgi:hypothetical protein